MTAFGWTWIVWVLGALVLAIAALRAQRVNGRKAIVYALMWTVIFVIAAIVFSSLGH